VEFELIWLVLEESVDMTPPLKLARAHHTCLVTLLIDSTPVPFVLEYTFYSSHQVCSKTSVRVRRMACRVIGGPLRPLWVSWVPHWLSWVASLPPRLNMHPL